MKNKILNDNKDLIDDMLFNLAKNDHQPIPKDIKDNIIKTINNTNFNTKELPIKKHPKIPFNRVYSRVITSPIRLIAIIFLLIILISTGIVGARNISEKFFNKDTVKLNGIGIANEFIFTEEIENALKQNVPLKLIQLDDNYYINVHSVLLDEINFFTVFELHSKSGVTDDLRFNINDLKITDENGAIIYDSYFESVSNVISGYSHIYNRENSIKQLFFMFGKDNSKIKELNFSFYNIEIYSYEKNLITDSNSEDIDIITEQQNINIPITKDNYNTIYEYVLEDGNVKNKYTIQKVIYARTGLYVLAECGFDSLKPFVKSDTSIYTPIYKLPLKRLDLDKGLMLYAYNINNFNNDNMIIYNELDKEKYTLIREN